MSILQPCPSRPLAICGLLFFEGFIDEGAQPGADVEVPLDDEALEAFPPGITVEGATPENEGRKGGQRPGHLSTRSWRTSGKNEGVAPSTSSPLVRRATPPGEGGTREAQPRFAFPQRTRGIRANPLPMRVSGHNLDHDGEDSAL